MKIELNKSKIDDEVMSFLHKNFTVDHYGRNETGFECTFIFQNKFDIIVPFNIYHGLIEYKREWISAHMRENSKMTVGLKIINRNPNPKAETLQNRYDEFIQLFEEQINSPQPVYDYVKRIQIQ